MSLLKIEPPKIPTNHAEFAKALADLADKYEIERFSMKYKPDIDYNHEHYDRRFNGDMTINYSTKDGRCRPCRNLTVNCDASFSITIESNQESSS